MLLSKTIVRNFLEGQKTCYGTLIVTAFSTRYFDGVSNKTELSGATLKTIARTLFNHRRSATGHRSVTPHHKKT